ncbi:MAG: glycoside hydrolase family 3 C-terminal domain-containing protein, partial [Lachnospiraceae bacterium]|nr:glycoside hydrolase family 3 C-terminal domain-containing protein [Lachnospiraceae bacterium]
MLEMEKKGTIWDASLRMEERLDWLISALTLDEKLHMLSSGSAGIERLGIPNCRLGGEAAHGVEARNDQNGIGTPDITTSFPQPIGMSSSWDLEAIRAAGDVVGREARIAYYRHPQGGISRWAPTVDLLRDPRWGRNEEAYGEDPVQVGTMAAAYVRGIQGDDREHMKCASTLKHFYANNTEIGRGWKNVSMSPRNKYELYMEPFRRCIEDGGVEGVMTAYNRINGVTGLFNEEVKNLLKDEFGLTHAVSDGGAMELSASFNHATAMDAETVARSIKAGVDALSGRPDAVYAGALEAYELGLLTEADVDQAIRNVYRTKIKLGIFDEDIYKDQLGELCSEQAQEVCKTLTDESLVLLKNDGMLPLSEDAVGDAVLIGLVGDQWYWDWYGGAAPEHLTLRDGLKENAAKRGQKEIPYVDGCDRIALKCGEKYLAADDEGNYRLLETPEVFILEDWGEGSYTLRNEQTGKYLYVNLFEEPIEGIQSVDGSPARITGKVCVGKDRIYSWFDLEVFRMERGEEGTIMRDRFGNRFFLAPDGTVITSHVAHQGLTPLSFTVETLRNGVEEATLAASKAGTVILALGYNAMVNAKEEIDRATIEFIPYQQRLFDEICKVNPNVAVVFTSNYPAAINEIHRKARAILWSATGSQCMGRSLADALVGKVSPAGRLTQTWYRSDDDLPDIDDYDIIGKGRTYRYFEGEVLYPFGYGLTYTTFVYDNLQLSIAHANRPARQGRNYKVVGQPNGVYDQVRKDDRVLEVKLTVTNTGSIASDEVVEIYAKLPEGTVKKAKKQLIGFQRVRDIAPGETRRVELSIPIRELSYYDVISESLIVEAGSYEITAAPSSASGGISKTIEVAGVTPGLRDLSKKIKADHFDTECGSQIVEGLYGYSALMSQGSNVYEPEKDGHFSANYGSCQFPKEATVLRLHGRA